MFSPQPKLNTARVGSIIPKKCGAAQMGRATPTHSVVIDYWGFTVGIDLGKGLQMCPGKAPSYGIGSVGVWLPGMPWIVNRLYLILPMVVEDIATQQALSLCTCLPALCSACPGGPSMQPRAPFPSFYFSSSLLMVPY